MNKIAALITKQGKIVVGNNHGMAYSLLTEEERIEVVSGFVIEDRFFTEDFKKAFAMKEIIIVRHGESENNVALSDSLDSQITGLGTDQCLKTAEFLSNYIKGDWHGFTSPFLRCLQTSHIIQKKLNIIFKVDPRLKENPYVMPVDGLKIQARKEYPFLWEKNDYVFYPEIETYLENVRDFIESLPNKSIIVTHGTPTITISELSQGVALINIPRWSERKVENASITHIRNQQLVCFGKVV